MSRGYPGTHCCSSSNAVYQRHGRCGTRLGAADAGYNGRRVWARGMRPGEETHLACKLRTTHPETTHFGGNRRAESGRRRRRRGTWCFRCCRSMMAVATYTLISGLCDWVGRPRLHRLWPSRLFLLVSVKSAECLPSCVESCSWPT
jgi:hypothetical protein